MFWFALTFALIIIDQLSKFEATHLGWSIFLNNQFAFSLPLPPVLMYLIYVLVLVGISVYVYNTWQRFNQTQKYAWVFVYAGGLSNIFERIVTGHVKDFIPIANGILNLADFFVIFGLVLLLISNRFTGNQQSDLEK